MAKIDPKAKAKRQKIIAAVLGVVLLGVLAWQVPSLMKTLNKKPAAQSAVAPPPAATTGAPAGTPVPAAAPTGSTTLTDSDPAPQAGSGQLLSFDRFSSKDPFAQQAEAPKTTPAPAPPAAKPVAEPPPPPPAATAASASTQRAAKATRARISVNGAAEDVSVGGDFPEADPVFHLVSLTAKRAKVSIAGGSLSTGASTVTLTKGKKVTLMNTADGTRYELLLVSIS